MAAPGTVVPLIAAETTIVPGQRLMSVMPRSWQVKPLYDILYGTMNKGDPAFSGTRRGEGGESRPSPNPPPLLRHRRKTHKTSQRLSE